METKSHQKTLVAITLLIAAVVVGLCIRPKKYNQLNRGSARLPTPIHIYHPYGVYFPIHPRSVFSVGDQVILEHTSIFPAPLDGQANANGFFDIRVDRVRNTVTLTPKYLIRTFSGKMISNEEICSSIQRSFSGTTHVPATEIKIECAKEIVITFTRGIPRNIFGIFILPEFSILPGSVTEVTGGSDSTGPYQVYESGAHRVELRRNPNFPEVLRANDSDVIYEKYAPATINAFINKLSRDEPSLTYAFGYALEEEGLTFLKKRGFKIRVHPNEWLVYLGFPESTPIGSREKLRDATFDYFHRNKPPFDFVEGISPEINFAPNRVLSNKAPNLTEKIAVLKEDAASPGLAPLLEGLRKIGLEIVVVDEFNDLTTQNIPYLQVIGLSATDTLAAYGYLSTIEKHVQNNLPKALIEKASYEANDSAYAKILFSIEESLFSSAALVPIARYPGIVIESPKLSKDPKFGEVWGTQAWMYKVTSND